jgi:ribosomal protein S12 methylthiotransferase accessory factor
LDYDLTDLLGAPGRAFTAKEYWPRLRPHLPRFGITRIGDITGLDRVGLPVAQVTRPSALSNAVTQGKGLTSEQAAVGAVLECVEMAAGEDLSHLAQTDPADPTPWRPLASPTDDWPNADTVWIAAHNLVDPTKMAVPRDVVSTDFSVNAPAAHAPIIRSSIGLGAGATLAESAWHGMMELIENDARIRADHHRNRGQRLAISQVASPEMAQILALLETANLRAALYLITARTGPYVVRALLCENPDTVTSLTLSAEGFAARLTVADAARAALIEAVQARLAMISGAREDLTAAHYAARPTDTDAAALWAEMGTPVPPAPLPPECAATSPRDLAQTLAEQGMGPIGLVVLHHDDVPVVVTRVVAPALYTDPDRPGWAS